MKQSLATLLVIGLCAGTALAQPPRGQGGPGGFGGFGGRGFGGSAQILSMPEVQKELGLKEEQIKQITEISTKNREEMQSLFGGFRDLSAEERTKKMEESRSKIEEAQKKTTEQIAKILDEAQANRLKELRIQRDGVMALGQDEVAGKLKLSDDQKEKIKKLLADARPTFGGPRGGGAPSEEDRAKAREAREKMNTELVGVLSADQKVEWEKMQGKKFEFPQGGPGGRRPNAN